ncbi:MAG: cytosine permease [Clostridiales bacterium]|nr:cytosine permease [Clostridiales bacterium]
MSRLPERLMPEDKTEALEDYSLKPVPLEKRKTWLDITMVWVGVAIVLSALLRGMMVGMGLGDLRSVLAAYLLGEGLLIGMMTLTGFMGARTGLSTALLARRAFGGRGSLVISLCLAVAFMGWFGVQAGLFAETMVSAVRIPLSVPRLAFLSGLLMMIPAVFGFRGLKVLSYGAVPPMVVIFLYAALKTGNHMLGAEELTSLARAHSPSPYPLAIGAAASIIAGGFIVGSVTSADIFRYARPRFREILLAATLSMAVSAAMQLIGSVMAMKTGLYHEDLPRLIIRPEHAGLGFVGFLAIAFAQWTTNDSNLYSSVLALNTILRWTRWKLAIAVGVLSSLLAAWGILGRLGLFLSLLSIAVGPVGGILVADYYLLRGERRERRTGENGRWNPVALAAYVLAVLIGWTTSGHPFNIKVFPFSIFAFNGIMASVLIYWAGMRISNWKKIHRAAAIE